MSCVFTLAFALAIGGCSKTKAGNGGVYLGGDDTSTETQVTKALVAARQDYESALAGIAQGADWASLYAASGCDDTDALCHASNLMSDEQRKYVRDLLVRTAPQALALLRNPVAIELVNDFPVAPVDSDGHPRDADAATQITYGSKVLLKLPALMKFSNADLRGVIVARLTHELLHQLLAVVDVAQLGPFTTSEGAREALTFAGTVLRVYSARAVVSSSPTPLPGPATPRYSSTVVAPLGIPGLVASGSPTAVTTQDGVTLFVVGKQDHMIYMNTFSGNIWSGFAPMAGGVTSAVDSIGASVYTLNGVAGIMVGVNVAGAIRLYWCAKGTCAFQNNVGNTNLGSTGPAIVTTTLPPSLTSRFNGATSQTDLYVWVTGVDGGSYVSYGPHSTAHPLNNYSPFDMGISADAVNLPSSGQFLRPGAFNHYDGKTYVRFYDPAVGWSALSSDPFTSAVAVGAAATSQQFVYAVPSAVDGSVSIWSFNIRGATWSSPVALTNTPTHLSPALVSYSGKFRLYTTGAEGFVYETVY